MFTRKINEALSLAILQPSFAKDYVKILRTNKDYLGQWLAFPHMENADTEGFYLQFIKDSLTKFAEGKSLVCAMIYQGKVVGNIAFHEIDDKTKVAKVGYWLKQEMQGNGIVTIALEKLIDIGFNELGMTKIQIRCATNNFASRAVPERLGFNLEGIITQAENINGHIYDHAVYGLHKSIDS